MTQRTYTTVSGFLFGLIALLHAARLLYGWEAVIGNWQLPLWLSGVGLLVSGYLTYTAYRLEK